MRGGRYASYERGMRAHNSLYLAALAGAAALLAGIPAIWGLARQLGG